MALTSDKKMVILILMFMNFAYAIRVAKNIKYTNKNIILLAINYINVALRPYLPIWIPLQEMGKLVDWVSFRH